jgi:chaperonin GroEL (HSP60 family)
MVIIVDISHDIEKLSMLSRRASKDIAFKSIKEYCRDPLSSSIILQACSMTGHSGQIYIDNTPAMESSIELTNGYTFSFGIEPNFCASSKTKEWKEYTPKVALIDGIIETVGEINRILEYCHNEKSACVIFARGFSQEVLGTLAVNKARETLNVIPVTVPFDLAGINSLVDLAKICGCGVISSLKGDSIAALAPEELAEVEYVNASTEKIVLLNDSTRSSVKMHAKRISEQKRGEELTDKVDLLNRRLKSLSSVCTNVRLAEADLAGQNVKLRVQHGINMLKHMCIHGYVNLEKCRNEAKSNSVSELISVLLYEGYSDVSAYEFFVGLKCGESLVNSILSSRVYLLIDENENG